jgi:hypothetical protein
MGVAMRKVPSELGQWELLRLRGPACGVPKVCLTCELRRWPGSAVRHHDRRCPSACSISSSSGFAAGWSCPAGHQPPRTRSCSCCGMRSPCCAAPIRGPGPAGPAGQSLRTGIVTSRDHSCAHGRLAVGNTSTPLWSGITGAHLGRGSVCAPPTGEVALTSARHFLPQR